MISIVADVIRWLFNILSFMVLARVLLSWLPNLRHSGIASFIYAFTEPILSPVRRLIDRSPLGGPGMMLDFSPIITLFLIQGMASFLINMLRAVSVVM